MCCDLETQNSVTCIKIKYSVEEITLETLAKLGGYSDPCIVFFFQRQCI